MHSGKFHDVEGILFDFGGTLDSDGEHWLDRFYGLYDTVGLKFPPAQIKQAFYAADDRCRANPDVAEAGLHFLMAYHVRVQFEVLELADTEAERAISGAFETRSRFFFRRNAALLAALKNRYRLGVVSNFYGNVAVLCEEAGFAPSLRVIFDSAVEGMEKPDPRFFLAATDALGLPPSRVVFVGDSYDRDIVPARELGMKTIWMPGPKSRTPIDAASADARIDRLVDLSGGMP